MLLIGEQSRRSCSVTFSSPAGDPGRSRPYYPDVGSSGFGPDQAAGGGGPWALSPPGCVGDPEDYIVAYQMLTRKAQVQAGDTVLVQGAGGGVGTALMQVAATMDVRVLGSDRSNKRAHVEAMGATLIDFETEDVVQRCRQVTGGRGVGAAFDGIGATAPTSLRALRRGGTLVWFGMVTMLSGGQRDPLKMAKTVAVTGAALAPNLVPGGKRTVFYSIQVLAKKQTSARCTARQRVRSRRCGTLISPLPRASWWPSWARRARARRRF